MVTRKLHTYDFAFVAHSVFPLDILCCSRTSLLTCNQHHGHHLVSCLKRQTFGPQNSTDELEYTFLQDPQVIRIHIQVRENLFQKTAVLFPLNHNNPNILLSLHLLKCYRAQALF